IMAEVIDFCLRPADQGGRGGHRVVVEPDARNDAIIEKNRAAGFSPVREATIMMGEIEKRALVSVCARADFDASALAPLVGAGGRDNGTPHVYAHLNADAFAVVQRHLVAKALSEFAHERLITPVRVSAEAGDASVDAGDSGPTSADAGKGSPAPEDAGKGSPAPEDAGEGTWELVIDGGRSYTFAARVLPLEHWLIDEGSITRRQGETEVPLDAQELVVELQDALAIPEDLLSTYLEELASTLAGAAYKLEDARAGRRPNSRALVDADFQTTEAAMTEGHPGFLANNGRIGFGLSDFRQWAPENGQLNRLE